MFVEVTFQGKGFAASLADVWLAARMRLDMCSQVRLVGKGFAADVALERLFSCESEVS